ncbi:HNH endonuclease signature motif containing protein [Mycolicibacterium neoaurum]|uniref:HNH endonuclease signature motif containing protein n=1 Tax=Mycolicibacterium neoaurum TaxID=1795 RepID=UPI0013B3C841|nr:HNH endonuclease signature motif containing protein [Mycolicibacterium neoaurum]
MGSDVVASRESVQHALSDRAASVKALLDADFTVFDTAELLALQSERDQRARADAVIDARIQAAIMQRSTAHEIGAKSWADVLITRMRLSAREAATRVRRAEQLAPRRCVTGILLDPALPLCAQALADGDINEGHVTVIAEAVRMATKYVDAAQCAQLEAILVPVARVSGPETVHQAAVRALYVMNQDGLGPDIARHTRGITVGTQDPDGLTRITGWVDAELAAYLGTVNDTWARPGINNPADPHSPANPETTDPETAPPPGPGTKTHDAAAAAAASPAPALPPLTGPAGRDTRSPAQRQHDALKAVLRDTIASGRLGQHNGLPVTVVVSTTLPELETAAGIAVTGTGTLMPMADLIRLAEHAHHYLVVYRHHTAEPLYLGRTKRLATKAQRLLLHHRDRGCTRPGCTRCANHCQAHHAQPSWAHGGHTDAPTLALGCPPDNQLAELGWTTTIDPTTGRVHWHPPPLLDTGQNTINHHFHPEELLSHPEEAVDDPERQDDS